MCPPKYPSWPGDKECTAMPEVHHRIGKAKDFPEHLSMFIQKHLEDPAIEVCAPAFLWDLS
jgi:hypothetical protein